MSLCDEGFPEECNDFFVEFAMKRRPIEAWIVSTDLRSLPRQCFAAGAGLAQCSKHLVLDHHSRRATTGWEFLSISGTLVQTNS